MLRRRNRRIGLWTGLAMLLSAIVVGLALSGSGAFAGAPVKTQSSPGKQTQISAPKVSGPAGKINVNKPARPDIVLYDQYNNQGTNATVSQNFEVANDAFDSELADDFVVPAGPGWSVNLVEVDG